MRPPKYLLSFLRWFCREDRIEEIEGDLLELFELRSEGSVRKARIRFFFDVMMSFRWINLRKPSFMWGEHILMRNYLKIGVRNVLRDSQYSLINLFGLSSGLAVFIIMIMLVNHELTYDRFHKKSDRVFQVIQEFRNVDGPDPEIWTSLLLSEALREEMTSVENAVSIHNAASSWVRANGKRFFEEGGIVAGAQFLEIFDYELKHGDPKTALKDLNSMVIGEEMAIKIFGYSNPVGEQIEFERYGQFTISGVLKELPSNSFMQFDFILPQKYDVFLTQVAPWFPEYFMSWRGDPSATFVLLSDSESAASFPEDIQPILEKNIEDPERINPHYLINLEDLHFGLNGIDGSIGEFRKGEQAQLQILILVAALILLMACFNYINISTTRSIRRAKEIGVRKSLGAFKVQVSIQFLTEAFVQLVISTVFAAVLIYFLLPYFNSITGIALTVTWSNMLTILPWLMATILLVTFAAGFYPAIFLSRFDPAKVLKGKAASGGSALLRNSLVLAQFGLVFVILSSLLIVHNQYQYLKGKDLGLDTDQLVIVEVNGGGVRSNFQNLKHDLKSNPRIQNVTGLTRMISGYRSGIGVFALDNEDPSIEHSARFYGMDEDGLETLGLDLLVGENFRGSNEDSTTIFLNETAAALYGGAGIVGETILLQDEEDGEFEFEARVGGIIKDFHYRSLHDPIGPVIIGYYVNPFQGLDDIVIKVSETDMVGTLSFIEEVHNRYDENDVMTWEFMDDMVQKSYESEMTFRSIFFGATMISLVMALLGIIGLVSYNVSSRTKEFGVRKVLGASYLQLILLHGKSYLFMIVASAAVLIPVVWILASGWLQEYAYRTDLTIDPFLLAIAVILLATLIPVWIINHRTARRNPVNALRYE